MPPVFQSGIHPTNVLPRSVPFVLWDWVLIALTSFHGMHSERPQLRPITSWPAVYDRMFPTGLEKWIKDWKARQTNSFVPLKQKLEADKIIFFAAALKSHFLLHRLPPLYSHWRLPVSPTLPWPRILHLRP